MTEQKPSGAGFPLSSPHHAVPLAREVHQTSAPRAPRVSAQRALSSLGSVINQRAF